MQGQNIFCFDLQLFIFLLLILFLNSVTLDYCPFQLDRYSFTQALLTAFKAVFTK
jgi:hypothetical protein